ncbi:MAG: 3D domain-containing protein [Defluviitaleaceae bacterium]|nr:3D domain-containing protein [Defluviitaleaceae bacterium]
MRNRTTALLAIAFLSIIFLALAQGGYRVYASETEIETVNISVGGSHFTIPFVYGATVEDILETLGVGIYHFNGNLARVLNPGDSVNLPHLTLQIFREEKAIPYETMVVINPNILNDDEIVTIFGQEGLEILYNVTIFHNNEEISTFTKEKEVIRYPLMAVVEMGSGEPKYIDIPQGRFRVINHFIAEATAYSPEQPNLSNYTFTGIRFTVGIVAVDPRVIPLGTYIYVTDYGLFLAADIGSAIQGYKVDLSFATIREALNFGRKDVEVFVLDKVTDLF